MENNGIKLWQKRYFKIVIASLLLGIIVTFVSCADKFLASQTELDSIAYDMKLFKSEFVEHEDWGKERYKEIRTRLEYIEENQIHMMIQMGIKPLRRKPVTAND